MAHVSPLRDHHLQEEASLIPYGPPGTDIELVESYGELDFEYAALRKACVLIDLPSRGVLEVRGGDRVDFLQNMLTQNLRGASPLEAGAVRQSFWLNRKGRIEADLTLAELGDRLLIDLDAHVAGATAASLTQFLFSEDVEIRDATPDLHRLALYGPTAPALLLGASGPPRGGELPRLAVQDLLDGTCTEVEIAGAPVAVFRRDSAGEVGLELVVPTEAAGDVYRRLLDVGKPDEATRADAPAARIKLRESGWLAYNTARIEAGEPLFLIDFGPDNVPAETGELLGRRVDFRKGCYLGQEVVARMHARGNPKQVLVALKPTGERLLSEDGFPRQPVGGAQVFSADDPTGNPIGGVTSSTISPMLGGEPVCFAIVRFAFSKPGTEVYVMAEGDRVKAVVHDGLRFLRK